MNYLRRWWIAVCLARFARTRRRAWERHFATLPDQIQQQLNRGEHPSQSHARLADALPAMNQLAEWLAQRNVVAIIDYGLYHCDRIVFSIEVDLRDAKRVEVPWFFEGYEILSNARQSDCVRL